MLDYINSRISLVLLSLRLVWWYVRMLNFWNKNIQYNYYKKYMLFYYFSLRFSFRIFFNRSNHINWFCILIYGLIKQIYFYSKVYFNIFQHARFMQILSMLICYKLRNSKFNGRCKRRLQFIQQFTIICDRHIYRIKVRFIFKLYSTIDCRIRINMWI